MPDTSAIREDMLPRIEAMLARVGNGLTRFARGPGFGRFVYYADSQRPWCLYASYTAMHAASQTGLMEQWTPAQRREAIDLLLDHQNPDDGLFHCPVCADDPVDPRQACQEDNPTFSAGVTKKTGDFLCRIGVEPRYTIKMPTDNILPDPPDEWLARTFRDNNPYSAGSIIGHSVGLRGISLRQAGSEPREDPLIRRVYDWLCAHQDPSGFFCAGDDLVNGMNGLLKMRYGMFDGIGLPVPNARQVVQTIMSLQREDGRFGPACEDWNATTLMISCGGDQPDLHDGIMQSVQRLLPAIEAKQDTYGAFAFTPGEEGWLVPTNVHSECLVHLRAFCERLLAE